MGTAHSTSSRSSDQRLMPGEPVCRQGPLWVTEDGENTWMVEAKSTRGLVQGGLPSATLDEVVFLAAASGPGARLRGRARGPVGQGSQQQWWRQSRGSIEAVLGGWREPYQRLAVAFKSPTQRSALGGRREGPGAGGSSAWLREAPPPAPSPPMAPRSRPCSVISQPGPRPGAQGDVEGGVSLPGRLPQAQASL